MSAFEDLSVMLDNFSGKVRLFPLPNLVLFPHVLQPLHIFEARYRDLFLDALGDDQLIAMAVLRPGWEKNYEGRPPLYPMACLGKITTHHNLSDGTYNVLLLGLQRIMLIEELHSSRLFREARVELCSDFYAPCPLSRHNALQKQLRDALMNALPMMPEVHEQLDQLLGHDVPLGVLTDMISYLLDIDMARKQSLLTELDVYRRAEILLSFLTEPVAHANVEQSSVLFPPAFSAN